MSNRFLAKYTVTPSGIIKISRGFGRAKSANQALGFASPCQSFQTSRSPVVGIESYTLSPDYPEPPPLKRGWGLLGAKNSMSIKTCRNLRERMVATELEYGTHGCFFVTLTLPTDDTRAFEALARYSSFAVNRIGVFLSDLMDDEFSRIGVWEYQKRGALHYHFLIGSDCIHALNIDYFRYKMAGAWMSILESIEKEFDCNMFGKGGKTRDKERLLRYNDLGQRFANVQRVEKSVSAYLSSYLSESNHDSKYKKNSLRKSFFPIATWSQWNRKATELFAKYSLEYETQIWAENYDDWTALNDILIASIKPAENTEILERKNLWWASTVMIAREKGLGLIALARDVIQGLKSMGITPRLFDGVKIQSKKKKEAQWERDYLIREAEMMIFEKEYRERSKFYLMGQRLAENLEQMMIIMLECEKELSLHKDFDSELKNYHQMEIQDAA
jgi:hypothetical protein